MEVGKSRIVAALRHAMSESGCEIRVIVSRRWHERDPLARARRLCQNNGVLIYLNPRARKFAFVYDPALDARLDRRFWDELALIFRRDLHSTHFENAVAMTILTLAVSLKAKAVAKT